MIKDEFYVLVNSCNCYVFLYYVEGYGLIMIEVMFYGKFVIVIGYLFNMDFMNVGNSFLV